MDRLGPAGGSHVRGLRAPRRGQSGSIDLYAVGQDGQVYTAYWRGGPGWHDWKPLSGHTFPQLAPVNALTTADSGYGAIDLYAVDTNGVVARNFFRNGSWSGWTTVGA